MSENERMPKGIQRFYRNDTFNKVAFGFITALTCFGEYSQYRAANEFRQFMGLDEEQASTLAIMKKYHRLRSDFRDMMPGLREHLDLEEEDAFMERLADEILKRSRRKTL